MQNPFNFIVIDSPFSIMENFNYKVYNYKPDSLVAYILSVFRCDIYNSQLELFIFWEISYYDKLSSNTHFH